MLTDGSSFVEAYAIVDGSLVYPDWRQAATHFDGVHLTFAAIAAIQGFSFPTKLPRIAPASAR